MRYMQCRCGKHTCYTSMGSPSCRGCEECKTTLAEGPDGHRTPEPHQWEVEWKVDPKTGDRWQERICLRCLITERVDPAAAAPEAV